MKELSNRIVIKPIAANMQHDSYTFSADSMILQPSMENSSGGCLYNYGRDYTIDMPDKQTLAEFRIARSCNITITDNDDVIYSFGDASYPAKVTIIPMLQKCTLKIEYSAPYPI